MEAPPQEAAATAAGEEVPPLPEGALTTDGQRLSLYSQIWGGDIPHDPEFSPELTPSPATLTGKPMPTWGSSIRKMANIMP